MAWTFVGKGTTTAVASGNLTLPFSGSEAAGDLLIAAITLRSTVGFATPSGWTKIEELLDGNTTVGATTSRSGVQLFYCVRGASNPSGSFTRTGGDLGIGAIFTYRSDAGGTITYDQSSSDGAAAANQFQDTAGFTPAANNALVVAVMAQATNNGISSMGADAYGTSSGSTTQGTGVAPSTTNWWKRDGTSTGTGADGGLGFAEIVVGTATFTDLIWGRHALTTGCEFAMAAAVFLEDTPAPTNDEVAVDTASLVHTQKTVVENETIPIGETQGELVFTLPDGLQEGDLVTISGVAEGDLFDTPDGWTAATPIYGTGDAAGTYTFAFYRTVPAEGLGATVTLSRSSTPTFLVFAGAEVTVADTEPDIIATATLAFTQQTVTVDESIPVAAQILAFAGQDVTTADGSADINTVESGTLVFTGQALGEDESLAVTPATLAFAGQEVTPTEGDFVAVDAGSVVFTGQDVAPTDAELVAIETATLVFTGQDVIDLDPHLVSVTPATLVFTGHTVTTSDATGVFSPAQGGGGVGGSSARRKGSANQWERQRELDRQHQERKRRRDRAIEREIEGLPPEEAENAASAQISGPDAASEIEEALSEIPVVYNADFWGRIGAQRPGPQNRFLPEEDEALLLLLL